MFRNVKSTQTALRLMLQSSKKVGDLHQSIVAKQTSPATVAIHRKQTHRPKITAPAYPKQPNAAQHSPFHLFATRPTTTQVNIKWAMEKTALMNPDAKLLALHSDIAGTLVDIFCRLPLVIFSYVFEKRGFKLTLEQVTAPMGGEKIDHVRDLLKEIKQPFFEKYHRYPTEEDAQAIYADFEELLFKSIDHKEYTELTPHTREVIAFIKNDLKMYLTTTSGYPEVAAEKALTQFSLLFKVDAKSAGGKRIKMILNNMHQLGLSLEDSHRTLFITDAERDIASVRAVTEPHLMPWIVAIADYSTHVEIMSTEHANSISAGDFADKRQKAHEKLNSAHIVISHMGELPLAIIAVQRAIQNGCRPATTQSLKLCYPEDEMQEDYRPAVKLR